MKTHVILYVFLLAFISFPCTVVAQTIKGQVIDSSGKPLSFVTIKIDNTKQGVIANLEGKFTISDQAKIIEVSHIGYITQKLEILQGIENIVITLKSSPTALEPILIVKTSGNKLHRILNMAIDHRSSNNPDNYDWYQCNVYYKMKMDIDDPQLSNYNSQTDSNRALQEPYFMLIETYSKRTWQKPVSLQEEIIASRMSGFSKPVMSSLVTDILPFHVYNDFINLNERDFYNPLSKGLYQRFHFKLVDEIVQRLDTTWVISFTPKSDPTELSGTLYITSDGFAVTHIIAHSIDITSKKDLGIEQQYAKYKNRWFPQQLNYNLQWQTGREDSIIVSVKGMSIIDSVTFTRDYNFKFDKAHTIKLLPNAEGVRDSTWLKLRPVQLDEREQQTYHELDSTFKKMKIEKLVSYGTKLTEGKFPAGKFDININRLYSYNTFENNRVGFGMQTNDKVSKYFSVGGWAGYGTKDQQWKYGAFAELYANRYKEFIIIASFYKDLRDPGRLQIHKEIDNNTLRIFLLNRADNVQGWNVSVRKKIGYMDIEARAGSEDIKPQYNYAFSSGNSIYTFFSVKEASLNFRYAYGETSSPFLGKYYSSDTKYPILYGRIISGKITNANINYTQAIAAASFTKNINRLGKEALLLSAGITFHKRSLPLSKLFAGNGFFAGGTFVYAFGSMETMLPYQFYSDRFINFYWLHQFNRSLFRIKISNDLLIAPKPAIAYNVLYGSLLNPSANYYVSFSVAEKGYHEAGFMLHNILRFKVLGLSYATLSAGYFHNIFNRYTYSLQGRFVYGMGIEL